MLQNLAINGIKKDFFKIVIAALDRYAKELGQVPEKVQIAMSVSPVEVKMNPSDPSENVLLSEAGPEHEGWTVALRADNVFKVLNNYQPVRTVTFKELMNVKFDFNGASEKIPGVIAGALFRLAEQHSLDPSKTFILLGRGVEEPVMYLYNGTDYTKVLSFHDILNEEILMEMVQQQ